MPALEADELTPAAPEIDRAVDQRPELRVGCLGEPLHLCGRKEPLFGLRDARQSHVPTRRFHDQPGVGGLVHDATQDPVALLDLSLIHI